MAIQLHTPTVEKRKTQRSLQSNEERTAQMRAKIIDAAITLLFSGGYGAATTTKVANKAGVSRGAMTHHFRTRADLMLAVTEKVMADQYRYRAEKIVYAHQPGPQRYFASADISWEVERRPEAVAVLEIMMASRNDRALQQRFAAYLDKVDQVRRQVAVMVAKDLGVDDVASIEHLLQVHLATLRGLSIQLMFTRRPEEIEKARQLFKHYEWTFAAELMARKKAQST